MPFYPPPSCSELIMEPPDSITVEQFLLDESYGRHPMSKSRDPFVCGLSGQRYSISQVKERVNFLSRTLAKELDWDANSGSEYDKVAAVFSVNCIDMVPLFWAIHRLGGIVTPANAGYNASELEYQLKASGATCLFTSVLNLEVALEAAGKLGIPKEKVFLLNLAPQVSGGKEEPKEYMTVERMITEGAKLPMFEPVELGKGEGAKRTAFLCFSSGTSGLPKGVMISHRNIIANVIQIHSHDIPYRKDLSPTSKPEDYQENKLGLLPISHIYALVFICHLGAWAGDSVIVLPGFKLDVFLQTIQDYKLSMLSVVPPMIIALTKNKNVVKKYNLDSVRTLMTGAAPMGKETGDELQAMFPKWFIRQAYGMTETATGVCYEPHTDIVGGSVGTILPGATIKIVDQATNTEITEYGKPGEMWVRAPSCTLGYLNNPKATEETFITTDDGYWVRTGDEVMVTQSPKTGHDHVWVVDRIKELIKVKGHQVAPAELEAHLLTHPAVADCAVIPIPDDRAGERPKAFVVKSNEIGLEENDRMVQRDIMKHVEKHKSDYKWVKEVEFVDVIPKSPSGKILRRMLRDKEKEKRRREGAKM